MKSQYEKLLKNAWENFWNAKTRREKINWGRYISEVGGYQKYPYSTNPENDLSDAAERYCYANIIGDERKIWRYGSMVAIHSHLAGKSIKTRSPI